MSDGIYERDKDLQVVHERDNALLASLGYKSEFKRAFSEFFVELVYYLYYFTVAV